MEKVRRIETTAELRLEMVVVQTKTVAMKVGFSMCFKAKAKNCGTLALEYKRKWEGKNVLGLFMMSMKEVDTSI